MNKPVLEQVVRKLLDAWQLPYVYNPNGADYEICAACKKNTEDDEHDEDCPYVSF